jgi:hypothetical protein
MQKEWINLLCDTSTENILVYTGMLLLIPSRFHNNNNHAIMDLGLLARSGFNIRIQKSVQWAARIPLSCWLVFHNSVRESEICPFYEHIISICPCNSWIYFPELVVFWDFHDILIPFVGKRYVFCGFPKNSITAAVIRDLCCSFSVRVSLSYSRVTRRSVFEGGTPFSDKEKTGLQIVPFLNSVVFL